MKKIISVSVILVLSILTGMLSAAKKQLTIPIYFIPISQGNSILRNKHDRVYSIVIRSYEGLQECKREYPIPLKTKKEDFKKYFYIIAFSDYSVGIGIDAFKQIRHMPSHYYLDVVDMGIKVKRLPPPEGKKYSAYAIIRVPNTLKISHIQIRDGIPNGLCRQFK